MLTVLQTTLYVYDAYLAASIFLGMIIGFAAIIVDVLLRLRMVEESQLSTVIAFDEHRLAVDEFARMYIKESTNMAEWAKYVNIALGVQEDVTSDADDLSHKRILN
jgi:hypothetical protein